MERTKSEYREKLTPRYKKWTEEIRKRDNFKCQCCGLGKEHFSRRLDTHHLYSYTEFPALRTVLDNGVALCGVCHRAFHKANGRTNNTEEQYRTWVFNEQNPCRCGGTFVRSAKRASHKFGDVEITVIGQPTLTCDRCGLDKGIIGQKLSSLLKQAYENGDSIVFYQPDLAAVVAS